MKFSKGLLDTDAIPVFTINDPSSELSPEFGKATQFAVPLTGTVAGQQGNCVQILQRRPSRYKCVLYVASLPTTVSTTAIQNVAVGASTVATPNLNNFNVIVTVSGGTVTQITINGVNTGQTSGSFLLKPGDLIATTNTVAPTYTTTLPSGAVLPTTVTATGNLVLSHDPATFSNPNNVFGYVIASAPHVIQWENQDALYAIATGVGPINLNVIDQSAAARVAKLPELQQRYDEYPLESGNEGFGETGNLFYERS